MIHKDKTSPTKIIIDLINKKEFPLDDLLERVKTDLKNFQGCGLIEEQVIDKFSVIDILWISTISDLVSYGFGINEIKVIKETLYNYTNDTEKHTLLEHLFLKAILSDCIIYLIINENREINIFDDLQYLEYLKSSNISAHLLIDFKKALEDNFNSLNQHPSFIIETLRSDEKAVMKAVRNDSYEIVKVVKKNSGIDLIEGTERVLPNIKISTLIHSEDYQNIEIKKSNGKVVSITRTLKNKVSK